MTRLSDGLLNEGDGPERTREKLLKIVDVLMGQVEQGSDHQGAAYAQFHRAAMLEEQVRQRTVDFERALDLLNLSNSKLAEANQDAEKARRNLANAIETVQEGFALFDSDDVLVMYNSRFATFLPDIRGALHEGITFETYVNLVSQSTFLDLTDRDNSTNWAKRRRDRHRDRHVIFNIHVMGDRWMQISEHRTPDDGTVILQTDVTNLVLAEREQRGKMLDDQARMIHATLDHISLGVCIFDADCRLVGVNQRLGYLLGIPMSQLVLGMGFDALHRRLAREMGFSNGMSASDLERWVHGAAPRVPVSFELSRRGKTVLVVSGEDLPDGGFVMALNDVTAERLALDELRRTNETLEARVAERTLDLKDALGRAERANAARSRFVAAASHDLLQPLSAAKLFVASASDDAESPHAQIVLDKAQNALASVENILSALLDISKLESGRSNLDIMVVPLMPILRQLRDEFTPLAIEKGIDLRIVSSSRTVKSDPTYLRRILQNLIGNAIRYTDSGRVLVGARHLPDGQTRIEVWDTGRGISKEEQPSIFREFHRLEGSASASVGMGLGLAIVDRACVQLGHALHLRSEVGQGTVFGIDLPNAPLALEPTTTLAETDLDTGETPTDVIALLVENDDELRRAMCLLLEKWGVSVVDVDSGENALALIDELGISPDIMLVDYQLGTGMDGLTVISEMHKKCGYIPVRLVTANRSKQLTAECKAAGVNIMHKPIEPQELETFVFSPK